MFLSRLVANRHQNGQWCENIRSRVFYEQQNRLSKIMPWRSPGKCKKDGIPNHICESFKLLYLVLIPSLAVFYCSVNLLDFVSKIVGLLVFSREDVLRLKIRVRVKINLKDFGGLKEGAGVEYEKLLLSPSSEGGSIPFLIIQGK